MKVSLYLSLLLGCFLISGTAEATPIEVGEAYNLAFSGQTCSSCWGSQTLPAITFDGMLTVVQVTGAQLWDPWYHTYMSSGLMVKGISGSLNVDCLGIAGCTGQGSYALSLMQSPQGDGCWLLDSSTPRYLVAFAGGLDSRFINDNRFNLFQWSDGQVPVSFETTSIPEPSTLLLLGIGLTAVAGVAGKRAWRR